MKLRAAARVGASQLGGHNPVQSTEGGLPCLMQSRLARQLHCAYRLFTASPSGALMPGRR